MSVEESEKRANQISQKFGEYENKNNTDGPEEIARKEAYKQKMEEEKRVRKILEYVANAVWQVRDGLPILSLSIGRILFLTFQNKIFFRSI